MPSLQTWKLLLAVTVLAVTLLTGTQDVPSQESIEPKAPDAARAEVDRAPVSFSLSLFDPRKRVTVLSGTSFILDSRRSKLLGVKESDDPEVRQQARKFTIAWFAHGGHPTILEGTPPETDDVLRALAEDAKSAR